MLSGLFDEEAGPLSRKKELTNRALKPAEVEKPKSIWELQGLLGLAVFVLGLLVGK